VVAYDLNSRTIKWKVPLGQDAEAAAEGGHDSGTFMAEHHGIIVTSTGLIFIAASDGKLRALDADTGKVLWTAALPAGSEGIPAMYEVSGRQYLVISASSNINSPINRWRKCWACHQNRSVLKCIRLWSFSISAVASS
jgi:quinoprotein glucose dehydrogenase